MKAKDMFNKLGYKTKETKHYIHYYMDLKLARRRVIEFNFYFKTVEVRVESYQTQASETFSIEELKAINKQCEELGWL